MSQTNKRKNILLCVAGMTPQIITETLYGLTQVQDIPVHEIRVITTIEGRNRILSTLLNPNGGILDQFCDDFGIDRASIRFDENCISLLRRRDGLLLDDVRTPDENDLAGDQICEIVRELCREPDNRIHASAAGGRKSMSIYLALAMALFARAKDTLSHALVSAEFENCRDFYYPRPRAEKISVFDPIERKTRSISTAEAKVFIAPIPFIRFCGTNFASTLSAGLPYNELVKAAQSFLDKDERRLPLTIDLAKQEIAVDDVNVRVTGYELLLFVMFADFRIAGRGDDGFVLIEAITRSDLESAFGRLMAAADLCGRIDESLIGSEWGFLVDLVMQLEDRREKLAAKSRKEFMISVVRAIGRLNKKLMKLPQKYRITSDDKKRPKRYGLKTAPELIRFTEIRQLRVQPSDSADS